MPDSCPNKPTIFFHFNEKENNGKGKVVLLDSDSELGHLSFELFEDRILIKDIKVAENHRRKGYATDLVLALVDKLASQNFDWGVCTEDGQLFRDYLYHSRTLDLQHLHFYQDMNWKDFRMEVASFIHSLPSEISTLAELAITEKGDKGEAAMKKLPEQFRDTAQELFIQWNMMPTRFPESLLAE